MEIFDQIILRLGEQIISLRGVILTLLMWALIYLTYKVSFQMLLPWLFDRQSVNENFQKKIRRTFRIMTLIAALYGVLWSTDLDFDLIPATYYSLYLTTVLKGLILILLAREMDFFMSKVLDQPEAKKKKEQEREFKTGQVSSPSRTIQNGVIIIAIIFILRNFNWDLTLLTFQDGKISLEISDVLLAILIFIFARLIAWLITQVALYSYYKSKQIDIGTQYAVNQLLTYVIFIFAFFIAIESLGVQFAWLWGGAAALLVGVGLGLQQTFNDLTSGIILLFERSIEVGNVVDMRGTVGIVKKIGLRTSQVETRDNIIIIVPNSKLIIDEVVNWSHFDNKARFNVTVGVAYGSDTKLVKDILLQVARENAFVLDHPSPAVNFDGFGESSLDFKLFFWSRNFMFIERVKSDIRFEIDRVFRINEVTVPFPQRDLWFRNSEKEEEKGKEKEDDSEE